MAIIKHAKNIIIKIKDKYMLNAGKITKNAEEVIMDATEKEIVFNGGKKIYVNGNI